MLYPKEVGQSTTARPALSLVTTPPTMRRSQVAQAATRANPAVQSTSQAVNARSRAGAPAGAVDKRSGDDGPPRSEAEPIAAPSPPSTAPARSEPGTHQS